MDRIDDGLETKAGAGGDIAALFAEFSSAFEEFKATNDQRLKEIEKRGTADGLLEGKLEKLNRVPVWWKALSGAWPAIRAAPRRSYPRMAVAQPMAVHPRMRACWRQSPTSRRAV